MVRTLVIGDLHFDNKPYGLLNAQRGTTIDIYNDALKSGPIDDVIFLGDLMMHRKPYPRVLLALKEVVDYISEKSNVFILRGNHDSETKADDGVTALSLFESKNVTIITHILVDDVSRRVYIPHYEDETRIKEALVTVPPGYTVFGHFGYYGSLNSAGDNDFFLTPADFSNFTILGHIHQYSRGENIALLGTPYTTNFAEYKKESFYGIIEDNRLEAFPIEFGPRHLVVDYDMVEENLDWINDGRYFTLLRINIDTVNEDQNNITELINKLNTGYVEIKYKPLVDTSDEVVIDSINPVTDINDSLIEEYINSSTTTIGKDTLLSGLKLIHENQQDRN